MFDSLWRNASKRVQSCAQTSLKEPSTLSLEIAPLFIELFNGVKQIFFSYESMLWMILNNQGANPWNISEQYLYYPKRLCVPGPIILCSLDQFLYNPFAFTILSWLLSLSQLIIMNVKLRHIKLKLTSSAFSL